MAKQTSSSTGDALERVSENIKTLRAVRKPNQERLAELAGFHHTYVSQLERCVTNISIEGFERLAHAFGVDVLELFM